MATLVSQFEGLTLALVQQSLPVRVLITLLIILGGLIVSKLVARAVNIVWKTRFRENEIVARLRGRGRSPGYVAEYLGIVLSLLLAMLYINASAANRIFSQVAAYVPRAITSILVLVLGIVLVKGVISVLREFVSNFDLREPARAVGISPQVVKAFLVVFKVFLYLVVVELAIVQLGVSPGIVDNTILAASYGMIALLVLLGYFGFRDLIHNYAAGIYLRNSEVLEVGKNVKIGDDKGEIRDISILSTTVSTDSGYFMLVPNKNLTDKNIYFKRVRAEIETLEDIKDYFITESVPHHGAAATEMALTIFGFDVTQGDVSETVEDEEPEPGDLIEAMKDLTDDEVKSAFVAGEKITNLGDEFKIWFNDGALLIPYFEKETLFPGAEEEHYALCAGVEDDEILVIDPAGGEESGGVYYVESHDMKRAIEAKDNGGYVVIAPKGTTAYWRIKNDLIYSSLSLYRQLSKSLEVQLSKILRRGRIVREVIPESVEDFIDRWREEREKGRILRMWRPARGENGDESSGNNG